MPSDPPPANARVPLLARMRVGTKLMLLVLLPVATLLAFTAISAVGKWRDADRLREFRSNTRLSFVIADAVEALAEERFIAAVDRDRLTAPRRRSLDAALQRAKDRAAGHGGPVDVVGRVDAARRQLTALRLEESSGTLEPSELADAYDVIARSLLDLVRDLDAGRPSRASGRAADAYVALLQAVEAAERERLNLAAADAGTAPAPLRWAALETASFDAFRQNAAGRLTTELDALLFSPAGLTVRRLRERFAQQPVIEVGSTVRTEWTNAAASRIAALRQLEQDAAQDLAATASDDHDAASAQARRELALSLLVVVAVGLLALGLRRSITRPLSEVGEGARQLSAGHLTVDVGYAGRDEIGDVASAFRNLRVTTEHVADEIRAMNVAIKENRLDHRADLADFQGTWVQLLGGMNDTMAAFSDLQTRRRQAEREAQRVFDLSLELLCIADADGYFRRINPAFERTLGYASEELLARPFIDFVHPDDREMTREALGRAGTEPVTGFENRYVHKDGSYRWLQWSSQGAPEEGLIYASARDVTESRRHREEQAALRRVATLVAEGAPPDILFGTVAEEVDRLLGSAGAQVVRYEPDNTITVLGSAPPGARNGGPPGDPLTAPITVEDRVWGAIVASGKDPAALPPDSEARLERFTDLVATALANAESRAQLAASRARVVTAGDEVRRRIERDLHDGIQQRLVSLVLDIRAVESLVPPEARELEERLERIAGGLTTTFDDLREIAMGIHPAILSKGGLGPALRTLARRSALPVELDIELERGVRFPEPIEVAAYYVVSEALTNAAKHAQAAVVHVDVHAGAGRLEVRVRDDGLGGARPSAGSGLVGLVDRVEALGGTMRISSPPGAGTTLHAILPMTGEDERAASS